MFRAIHKYIHICSSINIVFIKVTLIYLRILPCKQTLCESTSLYIGFTSANYVKPQVNRRMVCSKYTSFYYTHFF